MLSNVVNIYFQDREKEKKVHYMAEEGWRGKRSE